MLISGLPVSESTIENLQQTRHFIEEYMFNMDTVTANAVINYTLKDKFHFNQADLKPLLACHKEISRSFENDKKSRQHSQHTAKIPEWYTQTERGLKFLPDILAAELAGTILVFYAAEQHCRYEHGVYAEIS